MVLVLVSTGIWLVVHATVRGDAPTPPQPKTAVAPHVVVGAPPTGSGPIASGAPSPGAAPTAAPGLPAAPPTRIRIRAIGVNAPLVDLGLDSTGALEVPPATNRNLAGWYRDGTTPGSVGTAVVVGHVDTAQGPAVFWGLGALKASDTIAVDRSDGLTATFAVDDIQVFAKSDFPDERVYGDDGTAQLRLITCGGVYDRKHHQYPANVVVFAHLTGTART